MIRLTAAAALVACLTGCGDVNRALERASAARHVSADLLVEFTKAADAANRAVMADTDAASVTYAREADEAKLAVNKDIDTLGPMLKELGYAEETQLLQQFSTSFAEYSKLDRQILDLAVENTNLKAQRLSFGPAQSEADAIRDALRDQHPAAGAKDQWRVSALAATAVAAVREIQALEAPHIADLDDRVMSGIESRMTDAETTARTALTGLQGLVDPPSRQKLAAATAALDRFMALNAQIIALSRRNTSVRSLALSLDQKQKLIGPCEQQLRALRDAVARHGYPAGRSPKPS